MVDRNVYEIDSFPNALFTASSKVLIIAAEKDVVRAYKIEDGSYVAERWCTLSKIHCWINDSTLAVVGIPETKIDLWHITDNEIRVEKWFLDMANTIDFLAYDSESNRLLVLVWFNRVVGIDLTTKKQLWTVGSRWETCDVKNLSVRGDVVYMIYRMNKDVYLHKFFPQDKWQDSGSAERLSTTGMSSWVKQYTRDRELFDVFGDDLFIGSISYGAFFQPNRAFPFMIDHHDSLGIFYVIELKGGKRVWSCGSSGIITKWFDENEKRKILWAEKPRPTPDGKSLILSTTEPKIFLFHFFKEIQNRVADIAIALYDLLPPYVILLVYHWWEVLNDPEIDIDTSEEWFHYEKIAEVNRICGTITATSLLPLPSPSKYGDDKKNKKVG